MALHFRFRWIPFIATMIAVAVGIALGNWQTRRAAEKSAIETRMTQQEAQAPLHLMENLPSLNELEYRHVRMRGQFVPGWNVFLDNRPYKGRAGFHVLAPFRVAGTDRYVLVKRGWVARDVTDRTRVPEVPLPEGSVEIEGRVRRDTGQVLELGTPEPLRSGVIVQNAGIADFEEAGGWQMHAFVIEQLGEGDDRLVRDWPRPSTGVDKHRGYAFQWYGLAAAAFVFFIVTGLNRGTKPTDEQRS